MKNSRKRDRVIAAISHKESDVVPCQLDLTDNMREKLENYFDNKNFLNEIAGNHMVRAKNKNHQIIDERSYMDIFGVVWQKDSNGDIGSVRNYHFPNDDFDNAYEFPKPDRRLIDSKCNDMLKSEPDLFHIYEIGLSLFERAWSLRGMEDLLVDMKINPEFVDKLLDRITEYNLGVIDIAAQYPIDCIMLGDDWGQQRGLIMGYPLWKRFIQPRIKVMYERIKSHGLYVAQHSCGDNYELFPDLIDMGLDIYNTFQPEIYNFEEFKKEYGKSLTIYGGISTQGVFAHGTPKEVYDTTVRTIEVLGKDGGYIVAPTHQLMHDTPVENVLAFLDAVHGRPLQYQNL